ncbi:MAG: ABC transporter substrate-binding protein [Bacteroidia bacterium]|nr:ABC transporter substrate-binding protein [Bacteroidia bacterium]MDW8015502.1 ABC transporter substrate-binding protein [Bacteroidia bacterium]
MVQRWWKWVGILCLIGCRSVPPTLPDDALRIGVFSPYTSLDPIYARDQISVWIVQQLFMGLVSYDSSLRPVPAAASRWEVSPDGRLYRFYLQSNLHYAGRPNRRLQAQDVLYSWHRLAHPSWASPGTYLFRGIIKGWTAYQEGQAPKISGLRALSDSIVEVELEAPYALFLHLLTLPYAAIVLPEVAESLGRSFTRIPVGLGPFFLAYQEEGRLLVLKRDTGKVRKLVFRWYPNRLWAWIALQRGEIDAFEGTDRALEYLLRRDSLWCRSIQRLSIPHFGTEYLGMDTRPSSLFGDAEIRRALRALIWRLPLLEVLQINGTPARTFIPPPLLAQVPKDTLSFSPTALEKLRQQPLILYASPAFRELCEYLQVSLARQGITLQVEYILGASLRERISKGDIQLWKASWLADVPDGENFLILFESAQCAPAGPNTTRFTHPLMDSLVMKSRRTSSEAIRRTLYTQAESLLLATAPVIPLYHGHGVWLVSRRVRHFPQSPLPTWLPLTRVQVETSLPMN